jgi:hypothetical protein
VASIFDEKRLIPNPIWPVWVDSPSILPFAPACRSAAGAEQVHGVTGVLFDRRETWKYQSPSGGPCGPILHI